jgi:hypothetical protein
MLLHPPKNAEPIVKTEALGRMATEVGKARLAATNGARAAVSAAIVAVSVARAAVSAVKEKAGVAWGITRHRLPRIKCLPTFTTSSLAGQPIAA